MGHRDGDESGSGGGGCGLVAGVDGGVRQELAMAEVLRLLGVRVCKESRRLSGAGGGAYKLGREKRKQKVTYSNLHQNATCSSVLCMHCQRAGRQFSGSGS